MNKSPVQHWVDTIPPAHTARIPSSVESTPSNTKAKPRFISRDLSFQSDDSIGSSVESVLELRKPDPEAVLLGLGFGPKKDMSNISRIPNRFLQPSKLLPNLDLGKFLEQDGASNTSGPHSPMPSPSRRHPKA